MSKKLFSERLRRVTQQMECVPKFVWFMSSILFRKIPQRTSAKWRLFQGNYFKVIGQTLRHVQSRASELTRDNTGCVRLLPRL